MRAAVIGCGLIGGIYVDVLRELGHNVVAVVDVNHDAAADVASSAATFVDPIHLFTADLDLDVVGICTPPATHPKLISQCAEHGTPILCEKPVALDLAAAQAALDSCKRRAVPFAIGFKMRFEPLFRRVRDIIGEGQIGQLRHLHIAHYQPPRPERWSARVGVTAETLVHAIDLSRWLMGGEPVAATGTLVSSTADRQDQIARLCLTFDDGRDALVAGGWMAHYPGLGGSRDHQMLAVGDRGYVLAMRPGTIIVEGDGGQTVEQVAHGYREPFKAQWRAFSDVLAGGASGDLAREADALAVQRILDDVATPQGTPDNQSQSPGPMRSTRDGKHHTIRTHWRRLHRCGVGPCRHRDRRRRARRGPERIGSRGSPRC